MESIGERGIILRGQMVMILHFLGLRFMLFCWAHCEMQLMSFCRDDASPKLVTSKNCNVIDVLPVARAEGGVNSQVINHYQKEDWTQFGALGEPACTCIHSEIESKSLTAWRRPLRKLHIQLISQPLTPRNLLAP